MLGRETLTLWPGCYPYPPMVTSIHDTSVLQLAADV